ncbi:Protein CBR-NOLA-3 [Caenorhabditis briggsae]|uniref:Nucleolar protein 10 n=1 Tax=Caenorhabditis briggsae TaxID=6238 RepID=B6IIG5_CAEBR|nr:Protein CBR-NOLA-3 [Caenorhabditis briggsae]CAR99695.1 Protein CBR-NOLA-3 [Caenorhabditis briggsae]
MFLRYYLDENQQRVYTLKRTAPSGLQTLTAHPARFSPEDKNSKYRVIIKKRFGLLPTQKAKTVGILYTVRYYVLFFRSLVAVSSFHSFFSSLAGKLLAILSTTCSFGLSMSKLCKAVS